VNYLGSRTNDAGTADGAVPVGPWRCRGFTLIELLTVLAIIGVLVTLLLTAVAGAKRQSRQVRCMSQLRQVALAMDMYLDDFERRPPSFGALVRLKFLGHGEVLRCPEDKAGNWADLVQPGPNVFSRTSSIVAGPEVSPEPNGIGVEEPPMATSYLHPLPWTDESWNGLMQQGGNAGVAACQLHGLGRQNLESPSLYDFEGLVLRARRDGAVVRRKVFWTAAVRGGDADKSAEMAAPSFGTMPSEMVMPSVVEPAWPLLSDEPAPP
jgi:prepilin-type N-terminal cleavage/methylation domain-containing protein